MEDRYAVSDLVRTRHGVVECDIETHFQKPNLG
jgi:hypothetical protein